MNNFRCPNCNFLNFAGAESCKRCKTEFEHSASNHTANSTGGNSSTDSGNFSSSNFAGETNHYQAESPTYSNQEYGQSSGPSSSYSQNFQSHFNAQQPYNFSSPKLKSGLAIASMVMGCVGFVLCWGLFGLLSLPGLIMGIVAVVKANKKPHEYGGKGFAIAGIVINGFLVLLIPLVFAIAVPNLLAARRAANESSAIASMRTLLGAESTFMTTDATNRCGNLTDLEKAGLIDSQLAKGEKSGYKYVIAKNADGSCELFASPLVSNGVSATGMRSFYASTDEGEIRAANKNGAAAGKNDPILGMLDNSPTRTRRDISSETDY